MGATRSSYNGPEDKERREDEVAVRMLQARESFGLTQTEFALQIGITRDRLASYEEGRAPWRCDVALKACRQFFISEFWLATGCVTEEGLEFNEQVPFMDQKARLTMALAVQPVALSCPLGASFASCFEPYLRAEYAALLQMQKGFPRIIPLTTDGATYFENAAACIIDFWQRCRSGPEFSALFIAVLDYGNALHLSGANAAQIAEASKEMEKQISKIKPRR